MYHYSFPTFYFICPLACTPLYIRNGHIKTLVIPQSENLFISAHFSKDNSKNLWGGLPCDLPCNFISYHDSHHSLCLTHIDLSVLQWDLGMCYFLRLEHSSLPSWTSKHLLILHSPPSHTCSATVLQDSVTTVNPPLA